MTSLRNSVVRLVYTRKSGGGAFGDKNEELLLRNALSPRFQSIMSARDCFPRHGSLVGLTSSRCLSFNRTLGYLQRVSGPQIFVKGLKILLSQKKKRK